MKVTTELKNLIKREFAKKIEDAKSNSRKEYEEKFNKEKEKFINTDVYKNFIDAQKKLRKYLEDKEKENGDYYSSKEGFYYTSSYVSRDYEDFLRKSRTSYDSKAVDKIDRDMEMVLIKLTYEKDFENVKKLLSEYQINI